MRLLLMMMMSCLNVHAKLDNFASQYVQHHHTNIRKHASSPPPPLELLVCPNERKECGPTILWFEEDSTAPALQCTVITGDLTVHTDMNQLSPADINQGDNNLSFITQCIEEINGNLQIAFHMTLTTLENSFEKLKHIGKSLTIHNNRMLVTLQACFPVLLTIGLGLYIKGNPSLDAFDATAFQSLKAIGTDLQIGPDNHNLTSLDLIFSNLETAGAISIIGVENTRHHGTSDSKLTTMLNAFPLLLSITTGGLSILNNLGLFSMEFSFEKLSKIAYNVKIEGNTLIDVGTNFKALKELPRKAGAFCFKQNGSTKSITDIRLLHTPLLQYQLKKMTSNVRKQIEATLMDTYLEKSVSLRDSTDQKSINNALRLCAKPGSSLNTMNCLVNHIISTDMTYFDEGVVYDGNKEEPAFLLKLLQDSMGACENDHRCLLELLRHLPAFLLRET